ncbi:C6 zinc finger domain-containing protein [Fusarium denticulatum]|uniref:C6 zinc finger domain-containing protein n=1 Tax=Fusarium denticulatum TaxID=48507 RepID=A0A8H5XFP6_9HYPO|nr:C6 zinc finger domain-containing protein [Fusarium denticulatum]
MVNRCTQAGRSCPGYPESWDVVLRMQNKYAENKVQARVQKAKTGRMEQARREAATIPRRVHITAEVHSWNRFYQDYAIHSGIALFNLLPRFYTSSSSTCFQEALHAVTLVSSARQLQQSGLMVLARRHYGEAITALNVALDDTVLTADDSVLVALLLLSLFEMIVPECFRKDADFQCHIHFRGALLLLRWRAERARNSELDESCFMFLSHICVRVNPETTRGQPSTDIAIQLMSMFLNNEPFDVKWLALERFAAPWIKGPLLEPILGRAVDFKRRTRAQATIDHHSSRTEVIQLIKDGIAISKDLDATATSVKSSSNPDLPSHQQPTAFNNMFEVSTKTTEAVARCLYQTVRYHVVEQVSGLVTFVEEGSGIRHELDYQFDPSMRYMILEQVCGEICAVLGLELRFLERSETYLDESDWGPAP